MEKKGRWQEHGKQPPKPSPTPPAGPAADAFPGQSKGEWKQRHIRRTEEYKLSASTVRALTGLFGLVILAGIVVYLWPKWVPVPPPVVRTISAVYKAPPLPVNDFALADVHTLCAQTAVINPETATPRSFNYEQMLAEIDRLAGIRGSTTWFTWEKSTALVYVNAIGVALPNDDGSALVPYLLADDFEIPTTRGENLRAVPVAKIFEKVSTCKADWKLVVLDCQRLDHLWPAGVLTNDFVKATLDHLEVHKDQYPNLFVLFSCSPGEVTWVDPQTGQSAFGRAFCQAFYDEGEGDRDQKLTLQELYESVSRQVTGWSGRNRADRQTPLLFPESADPHEVQLIALAEQNRFAPLESAGAEALKADLSRLRDLWQQYYELVEQRPYVLRPHQWRWLEDALLVAERYWLANEADLMRTELSRAEGLVQELRRPAEAPARGCSLAMDEFLGTPGKELSDRLDELVRGQETFPKSAERVRQLELAGAVRPIEAHLVLLFEQLAQASGAGAESLARGQRLIELRREAERVAAAHGSVFAPQVAPWIEAHVDAADSLQRLLVDRYLARFTPTAPLQVGTFAKRNQTGSLYDQAAGLENSDLDQQWEKDVRGQYETAAQHAKTLVEAWGLYQQLLADLPHLCELLAARYWVQADAAFRSGFDEPTAALLNDTWVFGRQLQMEPPASAKELAGRVGAIGKHAEALRGTFGRLRQALRELAGKLGASDARPANQPEWHQIDFVLRVPFPAFENRPADAAELRLRLLQRLRQTVGEEAAQAGKVESQPEQRPISQTAELAHRLYALGTGREIAKGQTAGLPPAQAADEVARHWQSLLQRSGDESVGEQIGDLLNADAALRLVHGHGRKSQTDPVRALRGYRKAHLLAWHADRFAKDFWNGLAQDELPYFYRAADHYLRLIDAQRSRTMKRAGDVRAEIERLKPLALRLRPQPSALELIGADDAKPLQVELAGAADFPMGVSALSLAFEDPKLLERGPGPASANRSAAAFALKLKPGLTPIPQQAQTHLLVDLAFRGHRAGRLRIPVTLINDEVGETVAYRHLLSDEPEVRIRLSGGQQSQAKLLFVLDCSDSMTLPTSGGPMRMAVMKKVLADFAEFAQGTGIEVGIRVLGRRLRFDEETLEALAGDAKERYIARAMQDSEVVLPIGRFDRQDFERVVGQLEPTGSTPLFYALAHAVGDFRGIVGKEKRIIVISDGADTFHDDTYKPVAEGLRLVDSAYAGADVQLYTIGFNTDVVGLKQLRELSRRHHGETFEANNADELLRRVSGLAGTFRFVTSAGPRIETLKEDYRSLVLPPGRYDFKVERTSGQGTVHQVGQKSNVRLDRGQTHKLRFTPPDQLDYVDKDFEDARGRANTDRIALRLLDAKRNRGNLSLEMALFDKTDPQWRPKGFSVLVRPAGEVDPERLYAFHNLPFNVGGNHLPVWSMTFEDWPEKAARAAVEVRWTESDDGRATIDVENWQAAVLPEGILVTQCRFDNGTLKLKLRFPQASADFKLWGLGFAEPVESARQIYNGTHNVFTGTIQFKQKARPKTVVLTAPRSATSSLKAEIRIGTTGF